MTARRRPPTPIAATEGATPDPVAKSPVPGDSEQVDIDNLSLDEIVTTLEARSMDVAIEHLYAGASDSPAGPATDTARATAIRDRVGDVVGELHESLKRIEAFTQRLGSPL